MACITQRHRDFLAFVNQLRASHGLMPLRMSDILQKAAAQKAAQLASLPASIWNGDPHTIDGVTARELVLDKGYPDNSWSGENLLFGVDTAFEAFDIWLKSPAHRDNLLTREYAEIGIAGPVGGSWQRPGDVFDVWVTEFGSARTESARSCDVVGAPPAPPPPPRPPEKPRRPTTPAKPPPRNERKRRRRLRRMLRRIFGRRP